MSHLANLPLRQRLVLRKIQYEVGKEVHRALATRMERKLAYDSAKRRDKKVSCWPVISGIRGRSIVRDSLNALASGKQRVVSGWRVVSQRASSVATVEAETTRRKKHVAVDRQDAFRVRRG